MLKLNLEKIELLLLAGRRMDTGIDVFPVLDVVALPLKNQVHNLRVLLNPGLLLD